LLPIAVKVVRKFMSKKSLQSLRILDVI